MQLLPISGLPLIEPEDADSMVIEALGCQEVRLQIEQTMTNF